MESQLLFLPNLVLCVIVFLDILFTFKEGSLLKVCFLLVITSLFVMNYYAYAGVATRFQIVVVKSMRIIYVCCTMLAIIHLVTPKIPRWIVGVIVCSIVILIGIRIFYYNQIDIESLSHLPNQVFSVGWELYAPKPAARYAVFGMAVVAIAIVFYYYRLFVMRINLDSPYSKHLFWWIISLTVPLFLVTIFGILGTMGVYNQKFSSYLFSFFSCIIIFSILLRPRAMSEMAGGADAEIEA